MLVGEAKWAKRLDARPLRRELEAKAQALPRLAGDVRYAVCARERIDNAEGILAITAEDVFR